MTRDCKMGQVEGSPARNLPPGICVFPSEAPAALHMIAAACLLCQGPAAPRRNPQLWLLCVLCLPVSLVSLSLSVSCSLCLSPTPSSFLDFSFCFFPVLPRSSSFSPVPHACFCELFRSSAHLPTPSCSQRHSMAPSPAILPYPHQALKSSWLVHNPRAHFTEVLQSSCMGLRLDPGS